MSMGILLFVVTILLFATALSPWPYNQGWGSWPSMSFGLLSAMIFLLLVTGRL
jgi:hypothetical protein